MQFPPIENNWQRKKILDSKLFQQKAFDEVNELIIKERIGRKLILDDDNILIDFISCSYLGLDLDPRIINAASKNLEKCGVTFPAARTRAVVKSFIDLENLLNQIFCTSFVTIFSSLHLAHLGVLPLIASGELPSFPLQQNGICFVLDKTVHASVQINRGLMSQFGQVYMMDFHETDKLENLFSIINKDRQTVLAIADSIGSMGGAIDVTRLYELTEKYNGYLYLDDAHGTSIFGKNGCGYVLECLNHHFPKRLILASSLAKAFGAIAGIIAMPTPEDMRMIKRFAQTYIFGGPPALSIIDSAIASAQIHLTSEIEILQKKLWDNVNYFDELFGENVLNFSLRSPIRGILIGDEFKAINKSKLLQSNGIAVTTAMYPMVERNKSILRIALSAIHTKSQIKKLHSTLLEMEK